MENLEQDEMVIDDDTQKPVVITDVNQFVEILMAWHANKVAVLEHMLHIPDGTEIETDEGNNMILTGEVLDAFRTGVAISLMELGSLPFISDEPE